MGLDAAQNKGTHVCGSRHRETSGTMLQGKDLAGHDPGERTPGRSEEKDVDTDKGNSSLLSREVVHDNLAAGVFAGGSSAEHRDQELADAHTDSAP